VKTEQRRT